MSTSVGRRWIAIAATSALLATGCSFREMAVNRIGDALSSGGGVYESDDDLELVGDALPFSLKLIESLLVESPRHRGLLLAAAKGFTSYARIYVHDEADFSTELDFARSRQLRVRARNLYLRAHGYALRALEASYPGFADRLSRVPRSAALRVERREDVPLLYWSAVSLALAVSASRNEASLLARLPEADALLERALELDETWSDGVLHDVEIALASARPGRPELEVIRAHFERAFELSRGQRAGVFVAYAESVAIVRQDREAFLSLLESALAIDPKSAPSIQLANLVAQRRARWLLSRVDELILGSEPSPWKGEPK